MAEFSQTLRIKRKSTLSQGNFIFHILFFEMFIFKMFKIVVSYV